MRAPLTLVHLDRPELRSKMLELWREEVAALSSLPKAQWPFGAHLSSIGWDAYLSLFEDALHHHDMAWLALQLHRPAYWIPYTLRRQGRHSVRVRVSPDNEAARLAYGEFNLAYVRAVLTEAAQQGILVCTIVRAGTAADPRLSCSCMEGAVVSSSDVLAGHRAYEHSLSVSEICIPAGPNCHHTVFIPQWEER
jgi:hypothetical protein